MYGYYGEKLNVDHFRELEGLRVKSQQLAKLAIFIRQNRPLIPLKLISLSKVKIELPFMSAAYIAVFAIYFEHFETSVYGRET